MGQQIKSSLILLFVAAIWGFAFVAQRTGTEFVGPFLFNFGRMFLAALVLLVPILIAHKKEQKKNLQKKPFFENNKQLIKGGIICGVVIYLASSTQQIGIEFTTASKAGFLTTLYIVFVPIIVGTVILIKIYKKKKLEKIKKEKEEKEKSE